MVPWWWLIFSTIAGGVVGLIVVSILTVNRTRIDALWGVYDIALTIAHGKPGAWSRDELIEALERVDQ